MKQVDRVEMINSYRSDTRLGDMVRKLLIVQALTEVNDERYGDLSYRCDTLLIKQKRGIVLESDFIREASELLKEYGDPDGIGLS